MVCEAHHINSNFLKAVFYKFYSAHSWILCPKYSSHYIPNQTFLRDFFPKFKDLFLQDWLWMINSDKSWSSVTYLIFQVVLLLVLCTDLLLLSLAYLPKNTRNFVLT